MKLLTSQVLILLVLTAVTKACLCPIPPGGQDLFQYAYQQAGTVVKAKVLSEEIDAPCPFPPCLCVTPPCPASEGLEGRRIYKLRLLRTFKGTPPPTTFTAETLIDSVRCGIRLQVGTVYMLNMGGGAEPYFLWLCQYSKPWASVSSEERRFLRRCTEPNLSKSCSSGPIFIPAPTLPGPTISLPLPTE